MSPAPMRQPDQDPALWDRHTAAYEAGFEPLTDAFAAEALRLLRIPAGGRLLDVCAGTGGAALMAARGGARVSALDGSPAMVGRIRERAAAAGLDVAAEVADAGGLDLAPDSYDAALSCFGIVLLPEPAPALRAIRRALKPGGRVAVVTWTEPAAYELASRLGAAILAIREVADVRGTPPPAAPPGPPGPLPAQLRHTDPAALVALMEEGGFPRASVTRLEARLPAASALALGRDLAFAPGLAATLTSLGEDREAVVAEFVARLQADHGRGPVSLGAVAHVAVAEREGGA